MDTIIIESQKQLDDLLHWRDNNKDLVRNAKPVLEKGCISLFRNRSIYFKYNGRMIEYKLTKGDVRFEFDFDMDKMTVTVKTNNTILKELQSDLVQDIITVHHSAMAYMEHYNDEVVEILVAKTKGGKSKGKNGKKVAKKVVKMKNFKIKHIYKDDVIQTATKREYERHAEGWTVCGFWRHYKKSDKRVWIKSHTRGNKDKVEGKTYIIE